MNSTQPITEDSNQPTPTITVYYGQTHTQNNDYHHNWNNLDADDRHHAQQISNPALQRRYIAVHGQLRAILSEQLGQPADTLNIHKTPHGKPYLADHPELAFNLSHTANNFVIALGSNCQLGIDLEIEKPRHNLEGLVHKCFGEEEASYWEQLPDEKKLAEFYRFWTAKEAFVKATGLGISLGLQRCVINPQQPNSFLSIPNECGDASTWHLTEINLSKLDGQILYCSLCSDQAIAQPNFIRLP